MQSEVHPFLFEFQEIFCLNKFHQILVSNFQNLTHLLTFTITISFNKIEILISRLSIIRLFSISFTREDITQPGKIS